MKIAFPYPSYWPYVRRGVERCIHDIAGYLAGRGHEVHVITSTPGRPRVAYDGNVKITYLRQLSHPLVFAYRPRLRYLAFAASASRVLATSRSDVAHLWNYSIPWAPVLRSWLGMPYVLQVGVRGVRLPDPRRAGPISRMMTMDIRKAGRLVALTAGGAREVEEKFGVTCGVLAPPVDMRIFRPVSPRDQAPAVLFTSDLLDPLKGGRLLLRSWKYVRKQTPAARLLLAGPYGLAGFNSLPLAQIWSTIDDLVGAGARDSVELLGPGSVESLPELYSRSAVTVLPSLGEAFGMVLTESLACGTPVVATAGEGPGEIVTNRDVGRTVEILDRAEFESEERAEQLAGAIAAAIELAQVPQTAARCRDWAEQWSLDRVGMEEERLLSEATSRGMTLENARA